MTPEERPRFFSALHLADGRSSSAQAEAIILGLAYVASASGVFLHASNVPDSWLASQIEGHSRLSLAGWWAVLVAFPLFWFLQLRWLWRFVIWTRLLRHLAKLKLRLVATHPDRSGGIGFLSHFPPTFAPLVFALSCVVASVAIKEIVFVGVPLASMAAPFGAWLALVLVIFVGPLAVFAPSLARLRRRALLEYGVLASQHNRAFEAKWMQRKETGDDALGTADISSLSDLAAVFESVRAMRVIPAGQESLIPLLIATGLPALAVVATQVPLAEILKTVAGALL